MSSPSTESDADAPELSAASAQLASTATPEPFGDDAVASSPLPDSDEAGTVPDSVERSDGSQLTTSQEPVSQESVSEESADSEIDLTWHYIDTQTTEPPRRRWTRWAYGLAAVATVGLMIAGTQWVSGDADADGASASTTQPPTPVAAAGLPVAAATVPPSSNWELFWSDEFDGPALDETKWTAESSSFGDANGEEQCYTPDNVLLGNGLLTLEARRGFTECAEGGSAEFSSGMIRSRDKFFTTFGRFEMRAKLPAGQGMWPAFWMLSNNYPYGKGGRSGEIDIMEAIGSEPQKMVATAHWTYDKCGWACSRLGEEYVLPGSSTTEDFHVYAVEWTPRHIQWVVDDHVIYAMGEGERRNWGAAAERASADSLPFPAPFDETNPMYLLLNLAVGGVMSGEVDESTPFPARYEIDYVRVYKEAAR